MGQFFEALYAYKEKSAGLVSEIDRMRKDFNEVMDECREATNVLHVVVQQDTEGRVRNLEALGEQLNFT